MGQSVQFSQAVKALDAAASYGGKENYKIREAMESIVLEHDPTTSQEAAAIIKVLARRLEANPRYDALEQLAMSNLMTWSQNLASASQSSAASAAFGANPGAQPTVQAARVTT